MEDYIIITWKNGHPVAVGTEIAEVDAYDLAGKQLREMEGEYTTIHSAKDGELTKINRLTKKGSSLCHSKKSKSFH